MSLLTRGSLKPLQQGFTLIEVMLAMSITAIAAVMAYQAMDSAGRMAETVQAESEQLQQLSAVMNLMSDDFRHIVTRKVRDPDGGRFLSAFTYDEFSIPMVQLTRNGKFNPQPRVFQRDNLERVAYHLDDDKLIRYSWPMADHYSDLEPNEVVMFEEVSEFRMTFQYLEYPLSTSSSSEVQQRIKRESTKWPPAKLQQAAQNNNSDSGSNSGFETTPDLIEISFETKKWGKIQRRFDTTGYENASF